ALDDSGRLEKLVLSQHRDPTPPAAVDPALPAPDRAARVARVLRALAAHPAVPAVRDGFRRLLHGPPPARGRLPRARDSTDAGLAAEDGGNGALPPQPRVAAGRRPRARARAPRDAGAAGLGRRRPDVSRGARTPHGGPAPRRAPGRDPGRSPPGPRGGARARSPRRA